MLKFNLTAGTPAVHEATYEACSTYMQALEALASHVTVLCSSCGRASVSPSHWHDRG